MFRSTAMQATKQSKSLMISLLIAMNSLTAITASAQSEKSTTAPSAPNLQKQQAAAARPSHRRGGGAQSYKPDVLMVTAARNVTDDQLKEIADDLNCKIGDVIGKGAYRIFVLKTPKGKLAQTELALKKDTHIWMMQRDYMLEEEITDANEPVIKNKTGGQGSFLTLVRADKAWQLGPSGAGQQIAVLDSGCQVSIDELVHNSTKGYDATTIDAKLSLLSSPIGVAAGAAIGGPLGALGGLGLGALANVAGNAVNPGVSTDVDSFNQDGQLLRGHGTMVSTVAAGAINGDHACGVAPSATIYPIRGTDDLAICAGIWHLITTGGPKILNISQGPLADASQRPLDHLAFQLYHDSYGGIIFLSAGNHGELLGSAKSYLNVVSMVDTAGKFIEVNPSTGVGSAQGNCITFAAQGQLVDTVDRLGADDPSGGTSLSSPTCAGVAALVWSANPALNNRQVEAIMRSHAYIPTGVTYDANKYGYGIPDAAASVQAAMGG